MPASLDDIIASTRQRLAHPRIDTFQDIKHRAESHKPRGFRRHLEVASATRPAIIAELKKASPSRGVIRADFDPLKLAQELESEGASALSVLTDEEYFQGSLENLRTASSATKLPCLRKDFIVDEFQIVEARANCADAILLIVAALSQEELVRLRGHARQYEIDVLCEVHDEEELSRAIDAGFDLIGVNSRDLRTFQVNLQTAFRLAEKIPANVFRVAESGINSPNDLRELHEAGYGAFLIGEYLMKAESPGKALRAMLTTDN